MISLLFMKNETFFTFPSVIRIILKKAFGDFIHFYENATFFTKPSLMCLSQEAPTPEIIQNPFLREEIFTFVRKDLGKASHAVSSAAGGALSLLLLLLASQERKAGSAGSKASGMQKKRRSAAIILYKKTDLTLLFVMASFGFM